MATQSSSLPQCRTDLVIRKTGVSEFVVKLPGSGKYFQIGAAEEFLLRSLDGRHSSRSLCEDFEQQFGDALSADELQEFIVTVKPLGLFQRSGLSDKSESQATTSCEPDSDPEYGSSGSGNLLFYRRTLFNPDWMLNLLEPRLTFLWTRTFVVVSALSMFSALMIVWGNRSDLVSAFPNTMRWETMVLFWVTMIAVTMLHEMAHGLTCKHFGGEVREIGVLLVFFTPCFFCNVSDAWLIPKKSHRLWVTLAGGYCDLCSWALAVFVWRLTVQDSLLNYAAWIVLSICGGRILFNFNPLLRLDGYYLLSDWLEVPNLRQRATEYWMLHVGWLLWGADRPPPQRRGRTLVLYGGLIWLFALIFLDIVVLGLFRFLGGHMGLPGMIVTVLLLGIACRRVFHGFFSSEFSKMISLRPKRTAMWVCSIGVALLLLFVVPVQHVAHGDFDVRPGRLVEVHAPVAGFLEQIHHGEGDFVESDTLIAELKVPDLESQISRKQSEVEEVEATLKRLRTGARPEEVAEQQARVERAASWRDLGNRDLEQSRFGYEQEINALDQRIRQSETEVKYTINSVNRAGKLYQVGALAGDQYRSEYKRYEMSTSQLAQAQAAKLARQAAGVRTSESEVARREKELEDARAILSLMQAGSRPEEIEAMNARGNRLLEELNFLKVQRSKLKITSSASGTIATPRMRERVGQFAELGSLICVVEDVSLLNIEIAISEEDVCGIQVDRIAPSAMGSPESRRIQNLIKVYCHVENKDGKLKSGMTGIARINRGHRSLGLNMVNQALRYVRTEFWW
jgi:putative peptide zinc metalloprotease protein